MEAAGFMGKHMARVTEDNFIVSIRALKDLLVCEHLFNVFLPAKTITPSRQVSDLIHHLSLASRKVLGMWSA